MVKRNSIFLASGIGYLILSSSSSEVRGEKIIDNWGSSNDVYATEIKINKASYNMGLGMMLTSFVWGIVDAGKLVKKQNNELYKSIYGTDMPEGFDELVTNKTSDKTTTKNTSSKPPLTKTKK